MLMLQDTPIARAQRRRPASARQSCRRPESQGRKGPCWRGWSYAS